MRGTCKWEGGRWAPDVSVCHTLYCLYALYRESDSQQIAGVWYDLAAALFGAFADEDGEGEVGEQGSARVEGTQKNSEGKNTVKEKREKMAEQLQGIFSPH